MHKILHITFLLLFLSGTVHAQRRSYRIDSANVKHPLGLYFAFGGCFSGIDVYDNYFQNPHRAGYSPRLCWEFSNSMRFTAEFAHVPSFTFQPSWEKLNMKNFDLNLHLMARIKEQKAIFYILAGACNHRWTGKFIQQSAFYDAIKFYQPNTRIKRNFVKLNLGVGIERAFKHFELFAEYRYRFSPVEGAFAVTDVAVNAGIKKKIPLNKIFRGLQDRYTWF